MHSLLRQLARPRLAAVRCFAAASGELRKTPLHSAHLALGAKMAGFGGWDMPIQYPDGIMKSHLHTRESAGLFDVSHMLGVVIRGADRIPFMESLCVADLAALPSGMGTLSVLTNASGGIIDDMIVTNAGEHLYMVINAGHEDKDLPHMEQHLKKFVAGGKDCTMETLPHNGILALQGPKAAAVLQSLTRADISQMPFMSSQSMSVAGVECFVARSGYTGEDGFEIAVPPGSGGAHPATNIWSTLLDHPDVKPVGLGARDSLRLEAGLCLYGNDLDDTTSPIEGTLTWVVAKRRRDEDGSFVGSERILKELRDKSRTRARCGFVVESGAPVREGAKILDSSGSEIGTVTSGGFSPCLKKGIGMCYVPPPLAKVGTELTVAVRGKQQKITVAKMPFVPQNYYRGP